MGVILLFTNGLFKKKKKVKFYINIKCIFWFNEGRR